MLERKITLKDEVEGSEKNKGKQCHSIYFLMLIEVNTTWKKKNVKFIKIKTTGKVNWTDNEVQLLLEVSFEFKTENVYDVVNWESK